MEQEYKFCNKYDEIYLLIWAASEGEAKEFLRIYVKDPIDWKLQVL